MAVRPDAEFGEMLEFRGRVTRIIFASADGYTVLAATSSDGVDRTVQTHTSIKLDRGHDIVANGRWVNYKGRDQFKADTIKIDVPSEGRGIVRWLEQGHVKGVSDRTARRLLTYFGDRLPDVIGDAAMLATAGISAKRATLIAREWNNNAAQAEHTALLLKFGLRPSLVTRVLETFGASIKKVLDADPWELLDIDGIGFPTADKIAAANGLDMRSPNRISRGLEWALTETLNREGHTCYPREKLVDRSARLLGVDRSTILENLDRFVDGKRVILDEEHDLIYPLILWQAEMDIAAAIARMASRPVSNDDIISAEKAVRDAERELDVALDRAGGQYEAAVMAVAHPVSIITGGPGTGKTTTQRVVIRAKTMLGQRVVPGAPTGRAARRLSETTGYDAKTIHRILEYMPSEGGFKYNGTNRLPCDSVVLDEFSMVDVKIFAALIEAIRPETFLSPIGDVDQLASVGPGQLLRDLISSGLIPVATLTGVHRQAEGSGIAIAARRVNQGEEPLEAGEKLRGFRFVDSTTADVVGKVVRLMRSFLPEAGFDPLKDVQVLSCMRKGDAGVAKLNEAIKAALNPARDDGKSIKLGGKHLSIGDRVMQTRNDYKKGVYNGEVGMVVQVGHTTGDKGEKIATLKVDFSGVEAEYKHDDADDIELAYAATIHRSQGCEFPVVILVAADEQRSMLARNLLYTGMTRARAECFVVGSRTVVREAVKKSDNFRRYTGLRTKLERLMAPRMLEAA